jgi:hypothetical protein
MVNYIVAASKGLPADGRVLLALAARIDPELQRMMAFLAGGQRAGVSVRSEAGKAGLGGN